MYVSRLSFSRDPTLYSHSDWENYKPKYFSISSYLQRRGETDIEESTQIMSREEEENILQEEGLVKSRLFACYEYHRNSSVKCKLLTVLTLASALAGISLLILFTVMKNLGAFELSVLYQSKPRLSIKEYPSHEEIDKIIETMPSLYSEKNISANISTIGYSVENIAIKEISLYNAKKLADESDGSSCGYPLIWVVCGVHAREWTSPLTCVHFLHELITDDLLDKFRVKMIVMANPDGYIYSFQEYGDPRREFRKNRRKVGCDDDVHDGVDLNRNFGTGFNHGDDCEADYSWPWSPPCPFDSSPCSITYGGPEAFSEPETRAIRDAMTADVPWFSLSLHGNGDSWSYPYAHTGESVSSLGGDLEVAMAKVYEEFGVLYRHGCTSCVMYRAGGTMTDWAWEELGVTRPYTLELRNLCEVEVYQGTPTACIFQPDMEKAVNIILPEAWFGFRTLVNEAHNTDCNLR